MSDLISVIVNVYNGEKYIQKCLDSIVCQTYKNLEIIIVNDGSTDNTLDICNSYKDERIRIITTKNQGLGLSRNTGIDNSNGTVSVSFDGKTAVYRSESLFELEHAWAITVHKSQGSEYKAVIFAPSMQVKKLLTKKILYTAVTRAEDVFVLVAQDELISAMIENRNTGKRYTFLRSRIVNGD